MVKMASSDGVPAAPGMAAGSGPNESEHNEPGYVFAKEVDFRPYSFGSHGESYNQACPTGGPGGLICCEECAKKYSRYLSNTVKDMEVHRVNRNGREVQELLEFLQQGRTTLDHAYSVAEKKIPPLPKHPSGGGRTFSGTSAAYRRATTGASSETRQLHITSSIDIGLANSAFDMHMV